MKAFAHRSLELSRDAIRGGSGDMSRIQRSTSSRVNGAAALLAFSALAFGCAPDGDGDEELSTQSDAISKNNEFSDKIKFDQIGRIRPSYTGVLRALQVDASTAWGDSVGSVVKLSGVGRRGEGTLTVRQGEKGPVIATVEMKPGQPFVVQLPPVEKGKSSFWFEQNWQSGYDPTASDQRTGPLADFWVRNVEGGTFSMPSWLDKTTRHIALSCRETWGSSFGNPTTSVPRSDSIEISFDSAETVPFKVVPVTYGGFTVKDESSPVRFASESRKWVARYDELSPGIRANSVSLTKVNDTLVRLAASRPLLGYGDRSGGLSCSAELTP